MDTLRQKILADIQKTGFVSELNTVSSLVERGWSATHGMTYEDKDENRSREIDIVASKVYYDSQLAFRLTFYLIIEIKKSDRPWIIFTTKSPVRPILGWRIMNSCKNAYQWIPPDNPGKSGYHSLIFDPNCVSENSLRSDTLRVGKAFHEFDKNPSDKSKIYEALIGSCKAAFYLNMRNKSEALEEFELDKVVDIEITLPIVVLDGTLFEVYNNIGGEIEVVESNYIPVEFPYSSPNYRSNRFDTTFYPDVIRFSHFTDFLIKVEYWRVTMKEMMQDKLRLLGKKPDKRFSDLLGD